MEIIKKRIKTRIAEIKDSKDPDNRGKLVGLQEALSIIEEFEQEPPLEAWGDY